MQSVLSTIFDHVPPLRRLGTQRHFANFTRDAAGAQSPDDLYAAVHSLLSLLVRFDRAVVRYVDMSAGTFSDTFVTGISVGAWKLHATRPVEGTATEVAVQTGEPVVIADCADPSVAETYAGLGMSASLLPSLVCVPVIYDGKAVGAILLRSSRRDAFSKRSAERLVAVANHIAPVLVKSQDWTTAVRQSDEQVLLTKIAGLVGSTIDLGEVWDRFVDLVGEMIQFDRMVLALIQEDTATISDRFVYGVPVKNWDEKPDRKVIPLPAGGVMESRQARSMSMKQNDEAHLELLGYKMSEVTGLKSVMFAPLFAGDRVLGVLSIRSLKDHAYDEQDCLLFEKITTLLGGPVAVDELYSRSLKLVNEMKSRVHLETENTKLEEMNQAKARFISMVSHELRTPLTSIIAFTDIIGRNKRGTLSDRDLMHIDVVKRNGSRLRLLIEDLLAMSEIESGDISIIRSEFSLDESIRQLADSVAPILSAKNQKLVTEFSVPGVRLTTDRNRVEQIISNLVSNASKYSDEDTEIKIRVTPNGGTVRIAVIDNGTGIEEHEIPRLFDEFSRLDNDITRKNQGSGLGLAISRRLANALGGTVEVESKKGEGSTFTVELPVELPRAA